MKKTYEQFIEEKTQIGTNSGFKPIWLPDFLFDFQKALLEWLILKGRGAIYADCGLGKTPMQLVWSENIVRKTNGRVLILAPLSITNQTHEEADKFDIETFVSRDGKLDGKIIISNYERLHYFDWKDFEAVVCDESSCLKSFDSVTKEAVTRFMLKIKYRALFTATAAPNDYIELGTSSEALGYLPYMDMLKMFFKADNDAYAIGGTVKGGNRFGRNQNQLGGKYRFIGHSEHQFWRWVCSWARAIRKPSDLGFDDGKFKLPKLIINQNLVQNERPQNGMLFTMPAHGLKEERAEKRSTLKERCERAAELSNSVKDYSVAWCNLNDEGNLLEELLEDCVQISGSDSIEKKEENLELFRTKKVKRLVTKADISGFGSNWQHCNHQTYFPDHSFEKWYQAIRRSWRFGQKRPVTIDIITSEGEANALKNLQRKSANAEAMFSNLVQLMNDELKIVREDKFNQKLIAPSFL